MTDLQEAASICDANGARGYAVRARVELVEALTRRLAPGDPDRVADVLAAATDKAERLGMIPFTQRISRLPGGRPGPVRLRTDGREPRPAHPDQAGLQQPQPDRRYEAEPLLPVFQAVGMAADVAGSTKFTECEAGELYIR